MEISLQGALKTPSQEDRGQPGPPLIEDVPGSVEREAYRQRLARLLKVDERAWFAAHPVERLPVQGVTISALKSPA